MMEKVAKFPNLGPKSAPRERDRPAFVTLNLTALNRYYVGSFTSPIRPIALFGVAHRGSICFGGIWFIESSFGGGCSSG